MDEHNGNLKDIENIRKYWIEVTKLRNTVTELRNTLERFNSQLGEAEERKGELRYRQWDARSEQQKEKRISPWGGQN